MFQQENYELVA